MLNRYFVLIAFLPLLGGFAWLSGQVETSLHPEHASRSWRAEQAQKRDLLEFLDHAVALQHYFRSVNGRFAKDFAELSAHLPDALQAEFSVEIQLPSDVRADARQEFQIVATSKVAPQQLVVDQEYRLKANFLLPEPRPEYLRDRAAEYLEALNQAPAGLVPTEQGIYRGYFQFEKGHGIGVRPPVMGLRVEADTVGSSEARNLGEAGRDPSLFLEARAQAQVPVQAQVRELLHADALAIRKIDRGGGRAPASIHSGTLEIEPVSPEE